jgi:hypothetical protein
VIDPGTPRQQVDGKSPAAGLAVLMTAAMQSSMLTLSATG